jgi:cyclohexyl-isocyanide hydratase
MEDEAVLGWIRRQASGARAVFSVCTGALLCGAAGLLKGRRATTHWASFHLLPFFGAIPVNERVVVDGSWVFAAGVTAGIDGALRLAAELRGRQTTSLIPRSSGRHCPAHGMIGTVLMAFAGEPLTIFELTAR